SGTNGRVILAGRVAPERGSANSGVSAAGVQKERSKTNAHVEVAVDVAGERFRPNGHVLLASGVSAKRRTTNRHVKTTGSNGSKRTVTHGGVVEPGVGRVQRVISQCGGITGTIAGALCFERRRQRKPAERNCQGKKTATQRRAVVGSY